MCKPSILPNQKPQASKLHAVSLPYYQLCDTGVVLTETLGIFLVTWIDLYYSHYYGLKEPARVRPLRRRTAFSTYKPSVRPPLAESLRLYDQKEWSMQ